MKLTSLFIIASSFLAVSAFGVNPTRTAIKSPSSAFKRNAAANSPLFRDAQKIRGGAVPGWAAYNDALDKKPLVTKALTSLVGWALGDVLAQVGRASSESFVRGHTCTEVRWIGTEAEHRSALETTICVLAFAS